MLDDSSRAAFSPPISVTTAAAVVSPSTPCSLAIVAGLSPRAPSGSRVILYICLFSRHDGSWPPAWASKVSARGVIARFQIEFQMKKSEEN